MTGLRVAVVGAGRLGGFHAQKLAAMPDVQLVAIVDPVESQRTPLASQAGCAACADVRELIGRIDAAVIAAPTEHHHALGMALLQRGIHVLMEKPLAACATEAQALVEAARARGVVLQVGHVERFNPAFSAAVDVARDPKYIEAVRAGGFTFRSMDVGVVLDLMIHDLDLVLRLAQSKVCRVEALGLSVLGGHEDVANARIEFASGCVASLSASRVSPAASRRMQVWSPGGFVDIDFATRTTTIVRPSADVLDRRLDLARLGPEQLEHAKRHLIEEHLPCQTIQAPACDAIAAELADFVDAVRAGRPPQVTGQNGCDAVVLAEQILEEIASHSWDGQSRTLVGPHAAPLPAILTAPHWQASASVTESRREAG